MMIHPSLGPSSSAPLASVAAPPSVTPSEREIVDAVDAVLHDGRDQRIRMASECGAFQLGAGLLATGLGAAFGTPGVVVGTVIGAVGGAIMGVSASKRYMEGVDKFMTGYTFWALGGFGAFIAAASSVGGGAVAGTFAAVGAAALAAVAGGAMRSRRLQKAREDVQGLDKRLDQAIDFEAMVLRDLEGRRKAQQPAGRVDVDEDFVTVGGVRVPRGRS